MEGNACQGQQERHQVSLPGQAVQPVLDQPGPQQSDQDPDDGQSPPQ